MTFQSLLHVPGIFEKALEEVYGTALDAIEPEIIKAYWDPDTCPAEHLSVLAHALSVDLWEESWDELKDWLKRDLHSEDSSLRRRVVAMGAWVGKVLSEDPQLRQSLHENLESAARGAAPEFAGYLTRHIADTVKNWPDEEMSQQIELNIGKDLQYIRINGTIVGGLIGVTLYLLSQLPQWLPSLLG